MNTRTFLGGVGLVAALALTACGGGGSGGGTAASGAAGGGSALAAQADPSGQLAYVEKTLTAPAGQPITVNFSNPQSSGQPHNWVLVQPGQEDAVATAAAGNGGNVPAGTAGALAAGAVLQAGNSEPVQVPAQQAGTYSYICTFPGHYQAGMKGTLTVQ